MQWVKQQTQNWLNIAKADFEVDEQLLKVRNTYTAYSSASVGGEKGFAESG